MSDPTQCNSPDKCAMLLEAGRINHDDMTRCTQNGSSDCPLLTKQTGKPGSKEED
jgi:hypothetical protein